MDHDDGAPDAEPLLAYRSVRTWIDSVQRNSV